MKSPIVLVGPPRNVGGGVLAFCDNLERGLQRAAVKTERMWVGTGRSDDNNLEESAQGIKALLKSLPGIWQHCGGGRVVHINTSFTQKALVRDAIVYVMARLRGSRVVVEFHGGLPEQTPDALSVNAIRVLLGADALVVINDGQRQQFLSMNPGLEHKLHLIANPVDLPMLDMNAMIAARVAGPRLLYLSRVIPEKGLLESLRALGILKRRGVTLGMDVAGDGPAEPDARRIVQEEGLETQVVFHGRVAGEVKDRLFRNASVFMLPSYYMEGQPIALIEGLAYALPAVVTNMEPLASMVLNGVHGTHVPPRNAEAVADAVQALLQDPDHYVAMARNARELAEREHDLERTTERFLRLYSASRNGQTIRANRV
jgi:glycosyltransferase involved in cell wall biosynthesis